tara:strand:+ start:1200 stop:1607 length:408 start_codon:yes stop_codon:yes gene_type:complete
VLNIGLELRIANVMGNKNVKKTKPIMKRGYTLGEKKRIQSISPITHVKVNIIKKSFFGLLILFVSRFFKQHIIAVNKSKILTGWPAKNLIILWENSIKLPGSSLKRLPIPSEAVLSQYLERKILLAKGKIGFLNM